MYIEIILRFVFRSWITRYTDVYTVSSAITIRDRYTIFSSVRPSQRNERHFREVVWNRYFVSSPKITWTNKPVKTLYEN